MSDTALKEEQEEVVQTEPEQKQTEPERKSFSREDWEKTQEEKARGNGWIPFDEYMESGKDPAKWRTADAYNAVGEIIGQLKRQETDFNQRLEGVHKLTQAQMAIERDRLIAERDAAIEAGQKKEVHALDKQINALNQPPVTQVGDPVLAQWNQENAWILEKTPKAAFAYQIWEELKNQPIPTQDKLHKLEGEIKKHYPPSTPTRTTVPESEKGHGPKGFNGKPKSLTMNDLTHEERMVYKALPGAWKDEKEFLQAVADDRKAAKG